MPDIYDSRETTAELIQRFQYADSWRQQYDQRALEWYKLYVGWRKALDKKLKGRSNLHIPRTYEEVDTLRSRILKALFSSRPYIDFLPRPRDAVNPAILPELEAKAKIAGAILDDQLATIVPAFYDFITCFLVYPAAVASVGWRYETRKTKLKRSRLVPPTFMDTIMAILRGTQATPAMIVEEIEQEVVEYDDNDFQPIDFFDFWPDPRGRDLDSCRFVFQREWLTVKELQAKLELLARAGGGQVYEPADWDTLAGAAAQLQDGREDRLAAIGLGSDGSQGYWREPKKGYLMEVLHYWEDDRHALLVNRYETLYDGPSPYRRHGKKPFIATSFDPLPGEFYGLSAVQLIEHLQAELNTSRNQRIDVGSMVLNRMWKVKRDADINENELISRPHGVIWVDQPEDVTEVAFSDIPASVFNDENILKQDMENVLGVPAVVRGADPSSKQTATEVVTKNTSAGFRFDVKVMLYETLCLKRMAYLMDCNNQQFIDQARLVQVYSPLGQEWKRIEPWELLGEHDYAPAGSSVDPMANKEIRRQQLNELLNIVSTKPVVAQYVKIPELIRLLFQSYDVRAVDKLLVTPEELAAQQQAAQQAALAQNGGVPPGPAGPGPEVAPQMGPEQVAAVSQALGGGIRGPV
jgi:hypothetical protein